MGLANFEKLCLQLSTKKKARGLIQPHAGPNALLACKVEEAVGPRQSNLEIEKKTKPKLSFCSHHCKNKSWKIKDCVVRMLKFSLTLFMAFCKYSQKRLMHIAVSWADCAKVVLQSACV